MEIRLVKDGTRLYVPVGIVSDELGKKVLTASFLLDTGADITTVSALDALENGVDFSKLERKKVPTFGIGGEQGCEYRIKNVTMRFPLENGGFAYAPIKEIDIVRPDEDAGKDSSIFRIPSLMGTDVLKLLKLTYNSHPRLELKEAEKKQGAGPVSGP